MLESLSRPEIWVALAQIAVINILLSGDNAVVIALACRALPPKQARHAFIIGAAGIVVLMTVLTAFAAYMLSMPYIEMIGGALLIWIGIKLLLPGAGDEQVDASSSFWGAVRTIIVADIVMSLDNVLGMAGAARGHLGMLFVGMVITIPIILFGSAMIMKLMDRFPVLVKIGAGLLGWVAGEMAIADPAFQGAIAAHAHYMELVAPVLGAASVVIVGTLLARRRGAPVLDAASS